MANTKQAKKRVKQAEASRVRNQTIRTKLRTFIKNVQKAIMSGDKQAANEAYKKAVPVIDKSASDGIIHKNKAARHKSRLNAHVKNLAE